MEDCSVQNSFLHTNKQKDYLGFCLVWTHQQFKARCWFEENQCLKLTPPSLLASLIIFHINLAGFCIGKILIRGKNWTTENFHVFSELCVECLLSAILLDFRFFSRALQTACAKRPVPSSPISNALRTDAFRKYSENELLENDHLLGCSFNDRLLLRLLTALSRSWDLSCGCGTLSVWDWAAGPGTVLWVTLSFRHILTHD